MENVLVVKNATDISTGTFNSLEDYFAAMVVGDILVVGDGKEVYGLGDTVAAGIQEVQFFTKINTGKIICSVSIPRKNIISISNQDHTTGQNLKLRVGGTTSGTSLVIPSTGEGNFLLKNLSYNHLISTQRNSISVIKKASETAEAYIDRVVLTVNNTMAALTFPYCTAVKVGSSPNFGIDFEATSPNVDLFVGVDGIFVDYPSYSVQDAKVPLGAGVDVLAMEKDVSKNKGNGGYVENTDLWYSQPLQTNITANYDIATILWDGIHSSPTSSKKVASNKLAIAVEVDDDTTNVTDIILSLVSTVAAVVIDGTEDNVDENPST